MFEIVDAQSQEAVIKVVGVGGCGGNAVDHMIAEGVRGVDFISANTDVQALRRTQAKTQLQLGTGITAGMGGGTGTGAAPVVAEVAKDLNVLTVAVVTKPFAFEGKRQRVAQEGIEALGQHVDSLIIVPNEKLIEVLGNQVTLDQAFRAANDVLHG